MDDSVSFVGFEQGLKNCFNNSPVGRIINAPKQIASIFTALGEGDFQTVIDIGADNILKSQPFYFASIPGMIDNFID